MAGKGIGLTVRVVSLMLTAVIFYFGFMGILVWRGVSANETPQSDAIVVLGAAQFNGVPSSVLKARLNHAADLYAAKVAPKIVVTGGRQPGDKHSEAGASAAYLKTRGVPDRDVLREVQGRTSWESLEAAAVFMKARNIKKVVLVSDPFHDARIEAMANQLGLDPAVSPTRTSPISGAHLMPYAAKEVFHLGLGKALGFGRVARLEQDFTATR